ncbi:MAG: CvpA family protein [Chitinophagales bacterium]|nr:CvpA family protein [Chitinophagales bacterium]
MPDNFHMPIDIGFIAFFAYGFWQGYSRGIISTIFNVLLYVFGFVLAFKMAPTTTSILQTMFHSENPSMFLFAFLVNLATLMLVFRYAAAGLEGALRMAYLGVINQVIGGVAMGGFMVLIYSVLVWFAVKVQFINEATIAESKTYTLLEPLPGRAKNFAIRMKPFALDVWGTSMNWMDRLEQYGVQKTEIKDNKNYRPPDDFKAIEEEPATSPRTQPAAKPQPLLEDSDGIEE